MVFILLFGTIVEREFGKKLYVVIYLLSILAGNLFFMFFFPSSAAIGASGAAFGLLAAAMLTHPLSPIIKYIPIPVALVGVFYMIGEIANALTLADGIAHIAHVGGAFIGALVALTTRKEHAWKGILVIIAIIIILVFLGFLSLPF